MFSRRILRHHERLRGRLGRRVVRSEALGVRKPYYVYTPPGGARAGLPLVVFLRGHEREWVNPREDGSRVATVAQDLDALVHRGDLPPLVALFPGLCSADNHVHSCGVDMAGTWRARPRSVGTGRFWTFLADEFLPRATARLGGLVDGGPRVVVGFSLGGLMALRWAVRRPEAFDHVALYDGTLPWPAYDDPRADPPVGGDGCAGDDARPAPAFTDRIFARAGIFTPAFGPPARRRRALRRWNPTDALRRLDAGRLARLRRATFWIASAAQDGAHGNRDRARRVRRLLAARRVPLGFPAAEDVVLHPDARHSYAWADRFAVRVLVEALAAD